MAGTGDGRYDRRPWDQDERTPRYDYIGPWASKEEMLTTQALIAATVPGADLQELVRPPLAQIEPFRPRFGYRTRALSINDVVDVDAIYQQPASTRYTGGLSGYEGTQRNAQGQGFW